MKILIRTITPTRLKTPGVDCGAMTESEAEYCLNAIALGLAIAALAEERKRPKADWAIDLLHEATRIYESLSEEAREKLALDLKEQHNY